MSVKQLIHLIYIKCAFTGLSGGHTDPQYFRFYIVEARSKKRSIIRQHLHAPGDIKILQEGWKEEHRIDEVDDSKL